MPSSRARTAAHVFVVDLDGLELDPEDHHHLARVLRLRAGETVSASDGRGAWRLGTWTGEAVEAIGPVERDPAPEPPLMVGFAPVKGDRPEWVVQKLTEVGVDCIVALAAERSVVRWEGERADRNLARLRKVAREAAMQSRRTRLPEVQGIVPFADLVPGPGVALAEPGGEPPSLERPVVLVGPEGGWAPAELAAEVPRVALGASVLRAETAAVAAGVLLCALRVGLVGRCDPPPR